MRLSPLFPKKETREEKKLRKEKKKIEQEKKIDGELLETDIKLRDLKSSLALQLRKEILIAQSNKQKNIKNSANYSRIGVIFYSLNIIKAAQERMQEMTSTREIYNCVSDLGVALGMISGLNGKLGKMNPRNILKGIRNLNATSSGVGKDLMKMLSSLGDVEIEREDPISADELISVDVIERLINGESVESCTKTNYDVYQEAGKILDTLSENPEIRQEVMGENRDDSSAEVWKKLEEELKNLR